MSKFENEGVVYTRVSSSKQLREGDGIASQRRRCEDFARARGIRIIEHFSDDVSGSRAERPGMRDMLNFLAARSSKTAVIIDDISRLARGLKTHQTLRAAIASVGGELMSPNIEFSDDADSELIEFIQATIAQHARRKNGEQTKNRMRSRVLNGWWPFHPPVGLKHVNFLGGGKKLVRDEPLASIVVEALEGFASGRFQIVAEVKHFLEASPEFPKNNRGVVPQSKVDQLLNRAVYAGYVYSKGFGIENRPGQHEALISLQTWQQVQDRLNGKARVPYRKDLAEDFPLRQFVLCECGTPYTACHSKGRNKYYAYYHCPERTCSSYGKSIPREKLEREFEDLLGSLQPTEELFALARSMLSDIWDHQAKTAATRAKSLEVHAAKIEKEIEATIDKIVSTSTPAVHQALEKRVVSLEHEKRLTLEKATTARFDEKGFEETVRTALAFLGNPLKIWMLGRLNEKRTVLKLAFLERLTYVRNQGFRTADIALPFKVIRSFTNPELKMARPKRFELLTS